MFSHNISKNGEKTSICILLKMSMIKKKMTQGFMDDYNFSILSVYAFSALFGSAIQSILFRSFHRELAHIKILIIAFQLCFVRIAIIIIETGIEKGGHKKIMKLNFPCKVFFSVHVVMLCTEIFRAFHFVYPFLFKIFSILFKQTTTLRISFVGSRIL